jgi:hypothetical protein
VQGASRVPSQIEAIVCATACSEPIRVLPNSDAICSVSAKWMVLSSPLLDDVGTEQGRESTVCQGAWRAGVSSPASPPRPAPDFISAKPIHTLFPSAVTDIDIDTIRHLPLLVIQRG